MSTLVIRSQRVLIDGALRPASIAVRDGIITAINGFEKFGSSGDHFDFGSAVIMPGLVDTHVHINEPGREEWEGFATATRAAAAGGVTTLIEMPLNSIPATTTVEAFRAKVAAAKDRLAVDVGFWGGVVPGNTAGLRPLYEAGVFGFKCFLVPSGVAEFVHVGEAELREALPVLSSLGAVLLAHSELPGPIEEAAAEVRGDDPRRYSTWLKSRPRASENEAISLLIRLSREFDARIHVVHLSSSNVLACLRQARAAGTKITVETCPHYLTFTAEEIHDGATEFKCAPPIRERANREQLWQALADGSIDLVVTDHSPCPPAMKCRETGDFMRAWGGISSLELNLPIMWTEVQARGAGIPLLVRWLSEAPAGLAGLRQKGVIAVGHDADFVVWDPEAEFRVDAATLHQRHKLTPYAGRKLRGLVQATFLRGQMIYDHGTFPALAAGRVLKRGEA
ncbi:MAG TPA: allantoinase AllB [Terriglobales bacterium]|nr:allantoinase AllB [Terriglobales bacterium]